MTQLGGTLVAIFAWFAIASLVAAVLYAFFGHAKRADDLSDKLTDALLHGDVPRIHPELHNPPINSRAK
jgi:NAD(P)H-hydrate repair Nnr-like enzyme with NAD(P)H-hydrate dehydratase domain